MIFLTIGTQEPFDRLVRTVDAWCASAGKGGDLFGQITERAEYKPKHFEWVSSVTPEVFQAHCQQADFIVSHAGMGSIITALTYGKPIAILPRSAQLKEHRNDHQQATAKRLGNRPGLMVAHSEEELPGLLDTLVAGSGAMNAKTIAPFADRRLIEALRTFIHEK
ncbi:glycosyltransferase [Algihabitans albus]|uniref:glycosyltransferase n=1 Tax=Algihabitans albus TaxID=2164067 RepID=UPI0013C30445|nr:glycosyltransferase [Algihabitans albus]